jgi:3-deoxy-D-manno-octulosonate 8-phosphate phosphatase (KDO 8-P phosphatase)
MTLPLDERLVQVDVLVLDVDGVLTDGRVIYSDSGAEVQAFDVRDGTGLSLWRRAGKRAAAITGRGSEALQRRAVELGLNPVIQKAADKATAFVELLASLDVEPSRVIAIGDDLPDLPVLRRAGVGVAVADACPELRAAADFVTAAPGGRGAVREMIELVLKAQGRWQNLVASFA